MKKIIIFLMLLLSISFAYSQQYNSRGKEFWLGFMDNYFGTGTETLTLSIFISSNVPTAGIVEVPLLGWSKSFVITAQTTLEIQVPRNVGLVTTDEQVDTKGIHITTNDPVTVYAFNYIPMTSDAAIILPIQTIGYEYVIQAPSEVYNSEFLIVATENTKVIEITPSKTTLGNKPAGRPFTISLSKGQVYQVKSIDKGDLTGTRVRVPDKLTKIAVFGGAYCTNVGNCGCCCNHLYEQMFPIIPGRMMDYITVPYRTRQGDILRILATADTTVVTVNNRGPHKLNAYQYYDTLLANPSYIKSNKPISIAQLSRSRACDGIDNSDPFMIILSSVEMTLDAITFNAFQTSIINNNYYVNVIAPSNNLDSVILDGASIGNLFTNVTAYPQFSYARVPIKEGDHTLSNPAGVIAYVYGYGSHEAFGYSAGVNVLSDFINTSCPQDTFNIGDTISFPINFEKNNAILTIGKHTYRAVMSFNPNVLYPVLDSTMKYNYDGRLIINATAQDIQLPATLKDVKFKTMLGDSDCTSLSLDSLSWDSDYYPANKECTICVSTCKVGGKRLILSKEIPYLFQNSPNPAIYETQISFVITDESFIQLYIVDVLGNKIKTVINDNLKPGKYYEKISTEDLATGTYYYIMQTPSNSFIKKMYVIK